MWNTSRRRRKSGTRRNDLTFQDRNPPVRKSTIVSLLLTIAASGEAQISAYASASYGYTSNPLCNFEMQSDYILQGYWQLDYLKPASSSDFKMGYLGALMVFRDLVPRNYYEHRINAGTILRFPSAQATEGEEAEEQPFRGNTLELGAKLGARHDKAEYRQFDNWGGGVSGIYTWGEGSPSSGSLSNATDLRRYVLVPELDNLTSVFTLRLNVRSTSAGRFTLFGGGSVKHYITSKIDTSVFETVSSSGSSAQGKAKGKGKGLLSGTGNGKKDLLVDASSVNTLQFHVGAGASWKWEGGSAESEVLYRIDPGSSTRVLAQYTNSTLLSEDLYNDFFSHSGPEIKLGFRQQLPFELNMSLEGVTQWRKYLSPAFSLDGVETASTRLDLHGGVEVSLSRSVALGENLGIEIGLSCGALRNQSNDAYNDFSVRHWSVVFGAGF
jgi:hypothetical protein